MGPLTCSLPYSTAISMSLAYSGFLEAAKTRDGFVVASWALYFPMVAKSPESQTTIVPLAFNCSSEVVIMLNDWVKFLRDAEEIRKSSGGCFKPVRLEEFRV